MIVDFLILNSVFLVRGENLLLLPHFQVFTRFSFFLGCRKTGSLSLPTTHRLHTSSQLALILSKLHGHYQPFQPQFLNHSLLYMVSGDLW